MRAKKVGIIANHCNRATEFARYHEHRLGKWTIFGKPSACKDNLAVSKHMMKNARCRLESDGSLIAREDRIRQAGKNRVALLRL